mmetsp:Transcript_1344/g.1810  ORF Transcript_1344/g.1810 Transcript_1344/m.1810 type:complete len:112 (+) Transcript_1344:87-422(+)
MISLKQPRNTEFKSNMSDNPYSKTNYYQSGLYKKFDTESVQSNKNTIKTRNINDNNEYKMDFVDDGMILKTIEKLKEFESNLNPNELDESLKNIYDNISYIFYSYYLFGNH